MDFQLVIGRHIGNAFGMEAANLMRVKSPSGLHPKATGPRPPARVVAGGRRAQRE